MSDDDKKFLIRAISIYMALTEPITSDTKADKDAYEIIFSAYLDVEP
jgi:hypothetical protein